MTLAIRRGGLHVRIDNRWLAASFRFVPDARGYSWGIERGHFHWNAGFGFGVGWLVLRTGRTRR